MRTSNWLGHSLKLLLAVAAATIIIPQFSSAGEVKLAWDPSASAALAGYEVHSGNTTSGNYSRVRDVGNVTTCTVPELAAGTWYFAVRAYGKAGELSAFSNEVSAVVAATDTTPPVISSVGSSGITVSSATINWTTNEASDTQIDYGTTYSLGSSTVLNPAMVTSHAQSLSGLLAATTYYYRVKSRDAAGNLATSANYTFTTSAPSDTTAPTISAVASSGLSSTGVTITWNTSEAANSQIDYGTTAVYGSSSPLNSAMVTSHSQALSGLTAGTLYHYRVKSRDAAGNLATSVDYTFTTAATPDTTAPTISAVSSSGVSSTGATISWITSEAADSQVEYGQTTSYGSSSALNSAMVTSHSQALSGLTASTLYHYRVKSKDAAGNLATSGDFTFTTNETPDTEPPSITEVASPGLSSNGAIITWTTDEAADSRVEYGTTTAYGSSSALNDDLVTSHSQALSGLTAGTLYHFRVKSRDAAGNLATSGDYTFTTTLDEEYVLAFPRFSAMQSVMGKDTMAGIALANLSLQPAVLTFTAIEDDGELTTGKNISNPIIEELRAHAQLPIIDWQIFGDGLFNSGSNGWIKLESTTEDTLGFFLIFDSDLNLMDGANFSDTALTDFAFTEIQADGYNKISVINGNAADSTVTFNLMKADGTIRGSRSLVINRNGALTADLFSDLFPGIAPNAGDYVRVHSSQAVRSFHGMRQESDNISMLTGQDLAAGASTIYSPHYVVGGDYRTSLSVINLDSRAGTVAFRFIGENGVQIGETRYLSISANGKLHIDDPEFFLSPDSSTMTTGYVELTSSGLRLAGSTVFGDRINRRFSSALALISSLNTSVVFSHVASNDLYFTGIAMLNTQADRMATVTLELYSSDGILLQRKTDWLGAGQSQARLLTEYFPSFAGQDRTSGYVRLISDPPIASFALFGTHGLSALAAIPPQVIR